MMNILSSEQGLRREAIRRRLQGERRIDICRDLGRSLPWFDKWWAVYRRNPQTDFLDQSRAPRTSPQRLPLPVEQAVVAARQALEAAATPQTRYGLIGHRAVQNHLHELGVHPLPSLATIQRLLARHGLTHPLSSVREGAPYPWLVVEEPNAIHATDIITRHLQGGQEIQHFHTIDHYSHAVALSQHLDKTSATACAHLRQTWAVLGLPWIVQLDNEAAFCGGHTHARVLGQVLRLCLFCGIEVLFTPLYDPQRNYHIETFHSLWRQAFWSRYRFANLAHVQAEVPLFLHWYHHHYHPPALHGRTPAQVHPRRPQPSLTPALQRLLPAGRIPLTAGYCHVMRRVDGAGNIALLNETWPVGKHWVGEYVRATINTAAQTLTVWHKAEGSADWRWIKTRRFRLTETIHDLLPAFRRNPLRCREHLPA